MSTPSDYREVCIEEIISGYISVAIVIVVMVLWFTAGVLMAQHFGWFTILVGLFS